MNVRACALSVRVLGDGCAFYIFSLRYSMLYCLSFGRKVSSILDFLKITEIANQGGRLLHFQRLHEYLETADFKI